MTEFDEKDGKLVEIKPYIPCDHKWGDWFTPIAGREIQKRICFKCDEYQLLVPKGYDEDEIKPIRVDFGKIFARIFGMLLGLGIFGCIKYLFF